MGYQRCCVEHDPRCWDALHRKATCCLGRNGIIFIPPHCVLTVIRQRLIAGEEEVDNLIFGAGKGFLHHIDEFQYVYLSGMLMNHAKRTMHAASWALPPIRKGSLLQVL